MVARRSRSGFPRIRWRSPCSRSSAAESRLRRPTGSGKVSPTTAAHVRADLGDDVDFVLDGGPTTIGVESTIVDCSRSHPAILRLGGVDAATIDALVGDPVEQLTRGEVAAPGTLERHYSPAATVVVVEAGEVAARATGALASGARVGLLAITAPAGLPAGLEILRARPTPTSTPGSSTRACARPTSGSSTSCWRSRRRPTASAPRSPTVWRAPQPVAGYRDGDAGARRPIGIFDSGLGGLTVARALIDLLPAEQFVYFGDTGRFPYGPKPADEVLKYSLEIADLLVERSVKMLVVACNSASAVALDALRERLDVPVVGVIEPGVRAARDATRSGRVGVIGTVGTIASGAYQRAAAALADGHAHVCRVPRLRRVRRGRRRRLRPGARARRTAARAGDRGARRHARARLHALPVAVRTIGDVMGPDVVLVSSADETAFEVRDRLESDPTACRATPHRTASSRVATSTSSSSSARASSVPRSSRSNRGV